MAYYRCCSAVNRELAYIYRQRVRTAPQKPFAPAETLKHARGLKELRATAAAHRAQVILVLSTNPLSYGLFVTADDFGGR